jgi:hypothetical protein
LKNWEEVDQQVKSLHGLIYFSKSKVASSSSLKGQAQGSKPMQLKKPPSNPGLSSVSQASSGASMNLSFKAPPNPFKNQQQQQQPAQNVQFGQNLNNNNAFGINNNTSNMGGADDFFGGVSNTGSFQNSNNMNNSNRVGGVQQKPNNMMTINQGAGQGAPAKGNIMKLDYDPFADVDNSSSAGAFNNATSQQQPQFNSGNQNPFQNNQQQAGFGGGMAQQQQQGFNPGNNNFIQSNNMNGFNNMGGMAPQGGGFNQQSNPLGGGNSLPKSGGMGNNGGANLFGGGIGGNQGNTSTGERIFFFFFTQVGNFSEG